MPDPGGTGLWDRILAEVAGSVSPGCLDTWFCPLGFAGFDGNALDLTVPTETFRVSFSENYSDLLSQVIARVTGSCFKLRFTVTDAPEPASCESAQDGNLVAASNPLPVVRASDLRIPARRQPWLIDRLWTDRAVGIIGGSPKSGKTWLALDMAVSVASGTPCLGGFAVDCPGPVLLYAAEDSATALHDRLEALARIHQIDFDHLDVRVITVDSLRLDCPDDQQRLEATLAAHRPALLVLDPMVRVHAIDENVAGQVATLLGYLRSLQRKAGTAIALVHHIRKNASPSASGGYSLRGSGDLYAWLDSFLYLRKHQDQLTLAAEHRSAPSFGPVTLELAQPDGGGAYLRIAAAGEAAALPPCDSLTTRILDLLSGSSQPLTVDSLRSRLHVRNQRVVEALRKLSSEGRVEHIAHGYAIPVGKARPAHLPL